MLANPPTSSPIGAGGGDIWYADYETPWSYATCLNNLPFPFGHGGRPTYLSKAACCNGAYGGQVCTSESELVRVLRKYHLLTNISIFNNRYPMHVFVAWTTLHLFASQH